MAFRVDIENRAYLQIQEAIDYFNSLESNLGESFYLEFCSAIDTLEINPFFQI